MPPFSPSNLSLTIATGHTPLSFCPHPLPQKNKSKDKASAAKAARLAKRALKEAANPAAPVLNADGTPAPVVKAPKKDMRKSAQGRTKDGKKEEPSKTQQKKQARREQSIARKIEARKEAKAARGEAEGGGSDTEVSLHRSTLVDLVRMGVDTSLTWSLMAEDP